MTVQITILPNGLRVATDTVKEVETVSVGVWIGAGSRQEAAHENGVAHFLEHMAFKGTQTRSALQIAQEIENVGGYLNAYTSREVTAYYARILKKDIKLAIYLIADILQNSVFSPSEIAKEKEVVLQEIGQSNDTPDDIIFDYLQGVSFPDQAFGRPILGPAHHIKNMEPETLKKFIATHYCPTKMVLSAAGNVSHEKVVQLAKEVFSGLAPCKSISPTPASYKGGVYQETRKLEQTHIVLAFPGQSFQDRYYIGALYSTILGGGMSSRLFQEIREKRGLVYSIYSYSAPASDTGLFGIYAGTSPKEAENLIAAVKEELSKLPKTLKQEEIMCAQNQLKSGILMGLESTSTRARFLAQQLLTFGQIKTIPALKQQIDAITKEDLITFGEGLLKEPPSFAAIGPSEIRPDLYF